MDEDHSDGGFLETGKADRSVWLMKCPVVVAKSWKNQAASSSDSQPVAKVVLSLDPREPDDPSSLKFTMEMAGSETRNIPKSYSLNMFKDFVPMCIFSETNQEGASGFSCHLCTMSIYGCDNFLRRGRIASILLFVTYALFLVLFVIDRVAMEGKVIDNDRGVHMRPIPGMIGLISSNPKDKKKTTPVKQSDVKRTRRDRGELEDIMFKLFERQPNWALKQLVQETDQPAQFLKEILNELCVYNKRGTNQGTYELKPEYKKSVEDTVAE
ncbi:hypothetical protein CRYUN_Cryun27aG0102000 [Craigia yunnanensis]